MGINLLPKEIKEEKEQKKIILNVLLGCILLLFIIIAALIALTMAGQILTTNLETLNYQIQQEQQQAKNLKNIEEKVKTINDLLDTIENLNAQRPIWSTIIKELSASVPKTVQITSLSLNSKQAPNINLAGKAAFFRDIIDLKEKLEASPYFKDVTFSSSNKNMNKNQVSYDFTLTFNLENKGNKK